MEIHGRSHIVLAMRVNAVKNAKAVERCD